MEAEGIFLSNLHWFELGQFGALGHTVLTIVGQVPYIGDISHIANLIAEVPEVAMNDIETNIGTAVAEVSVVIDGRSAYVHADVSGSNWLKHVFLACKRVVYSEFSCFVQHVAKLKN
jgi:hypothetical protein